MQDLVATAVLNGFDAGSEANPGSPGLNLARDDVEANSPKRFDVELLIVHPTFDPAEMLRRAEIAIGCFRREPRRLSFSHYLTRCRQSERYSGHRWPTTRRFIRRQRLGGGGTRAQRPPHSIDVPAHAENGRLVPGVEK